MTIPVGSAGGMANGLPMKQASSPECLRLLCDLSVTAGGESAMGRNAETLPTAPGVLVLVVGARSGRNTGVVPDSGVQTAGGGTDVVA